MQCLLDQVCIRLPLVSRINQVDYRDQKLSKRDIIIKSKEEIGWTHISS
jgi:hypothetical protein